MNSINRIFLACSILVFSACGGDQTTTEEVTEVVVNEPVEEVEEMEEDFPFILPSPLQIASIFKKSGLIYQAGIGNDPANIDKYESKLSKSLNFGVYGADLSYCVLNNQAQPAIEYMNAVRKLSDELGISTIFNAQSLFTSFEKNMGVEDSLIDILATVQEKLDEHLDDNGLQYMSAVYFTGGWLEAMYIGGQVVENDKKSRLIVRLTEQMTILDLLVRGLAYYPDKTPDLEMLIKDLNDIHNIYLNFGAVKALSSNGEEMGEELEVTEEEITSILSKITEVRNRIING